MNRILRLVVFSSVLTTLVLCSAYADREQPAKSPRTISSGSPVARPGGSPSGRTISGQPYTRVDNQNSAGVRRPGSTPPPQPSRRPDSDITVVRPGRPGSPISPQPYRRDDLDRGRYGYSGGDRAYELPQRLRWEGDHRPDRDYRPYRNDHYWYGGPGWGSSWGWGWGFGYSDPFRREVLVPVPYPVPGPTVYYPAPSVEYVPQPYPAAGAADVTPNTPPEQLPLLGCDLMAGDGTFLGVVDREYTSPQSIANRDGEFGSRTSKVSIWNPASPYGSPTGQYSPWDEKAEKPPMLSWHGAFKGYLTKNPNIKPAISPDALPEVIQAAPGGSAGTIG